MYTVHVWIKHVDCCKRKIRCLPVDCARWSSPTGSSGYTSAWIHPLFPPHTCRECWIRCCWCRWPCGRALGSCAPGGCPASPSRGPQVAEALCAPTQTPEAWWRSHRHTAQERQPWSKLCTLWIPWNCCGCACEQKPCRRLTCEHSHTCHTTASCNPRHAQSVSHTTQNTSCVIYI